MNDRPPPLVLRSIGTTIAARSYGVEGRDEPIVVLIGRPELFPEGFDYYCPFQILGLDSDRVRRAGGIDAIQAIVHALEAIHVTLAHSPEGRAGKIHWASDHDLAHCLLTRNLA